MLLTCTVYYGLRSSRRRWRLLRSRYCLVVVQIDLPVLLHIVSPTPAPTHPMILSETPFPTSSQAPTLGRGNVAGCLGGGTRGLGIGGAVILSPAVLINALVSPLRPSISLSVSPHAAMTAVLRPFEALVLRRAHARRSAEGSTLGERAPD